MIVLDTDVLSAVMRREPVPTVVAWLDRQPSESVWITALTVFEIRFGIGTLPAGRRRQQLEDAFDRVVVEDLQGRVLPFDQEAAHEAAGRAAGRRAAGRPVDFRDVESAGIVAARRATLATRNVRHFADLDVALVDPWASR
jgi:predicted nucleic acid-binding protein